MIVNFASIYDFLAADYEHLLLYRGRKYRSVFDAYLSLSGGREDDLLLMEDLIFTKFFEDHELRDRLLRTQPIGLHHGNVTCDNFWGWCMCADCYFSRHKHLNHLGKILMYVRDLFVKK